MSESYLLDDGRVVEAHLEPGQAICCTCGTVYDYHASQRRHICSPTELGVPARSFTEAIERHDEQIRLALGAPGRILHFRPPGWVRNICGEQGRSIGQIDRFASSAYRCGACAAEAAQRGMIPGREPAKIDSHAYPAAPDICPDCGQAKLPGYSKCFYCEQLDGVRVRNSAQLAAYDAEMERMHRPHWHPKLTRRDVPVFLMGGGAALSLAPGWWSTAGMAIASTGLLGLAWHSGGLHR